MSWNQEMMKESVEGDWQWAYRLKTKRWVKVHCSFVEQGNYDHDQLVMKLKCDKGEWFLVDGTAWYQICGVDGLTAYAGYYNVYSVAFLQPKKEFYQEWKLPHPSNICTPKFFYSTRACKCEIDTNQRSQAYYDEQGR